MWKSAKQALDPKALFSPDPHMQRAQSQATPAASGRNGGGSNGGSRPLRTPPRQPQPQPGGGVESPSPRRPPTPTSVSNHARAVQDSLEETRMLLAAQKDVNRVLDAEVRKLMAQLEDLNRRYVTQGRRTADLTEQLAVAGSGDFQTLRSQLARAQQANADLQKVAHEKVASMRAERDALAAEVAAARRQLAERQDDSEQVEALKGELEEAHRAALAAEHRADTEAASAERQRAAAQELTAELERVQAEKVAGEDALQAVQSALGAAQADGTAAHGEAATLAAALDAAEKARAALEGDLALHVERHAAGMQDLDALTHQLSAAQSEAAAGGARVAELEAELKGSEREVRALTKARDMMEVDLKAVLGRHAREVDTAATARREAAKAQAARADAEAAAEQTRAYAENAVSELKQRVAQLQAERSALAAQSEQHRSGLEAKTGDIARMAGQLADAQAQSHSMSQQVARLEGQRARLEAELREISDSAARADALHGELQDVQALAAAAQAEAAARAAEVSALQAELEGASARAAAVEGAAAARAEAQSSSEEAALSLMQELQRANAKAASAQREAGAAAAQLAALEEQHAGLLAGIEAHDAEVGEEVERLRAEQADAQAAAQEAREDARALATQLQTEEGLRASLASQLEAAEAKKASFAEKLAAAEKDGIQRAESLALRDEVAEARMAAAAAETAAARAEGARVALETELATIKQREKEKDLEAARLRSVSAADVAALKSRSELLNGQKASLLSEMQAMTEAHKARAAEVEQLRRELADAQAVAALRVAGGASAPLSLRSGGAAASGDGGPGSNQGSMPVTPTASWTQPQGRRSTGGRIFGSHAAAVNGSDAYDFAEGAEAEEMDPEQLAALKEEMKKLGQEKAAAETSLKDLASQLNTQRGAAAAEAGDVNNLKQFWQDNERLQKEKTAAERKLQRLAHRLGLQRGAGAAIGGDSTSRAEQMERQIGQLRQEREAAALEVGALKSRLAAADARLAQLGAEAQHSSEATAFAGSPAAVAEPSAPAQQPADGEAAADKSVTAADSEAATAREEAHAQLSAYAEQLRVQNEELQQQLAAAAEQEAKAAAAKQAAEAAVAELRAEAATLRAEAAASADARRDAEAARGALAAAEARAQALEVQLSPLGATAGPPASPPAVLLATEQADEGHLPSPRSDHSGSFRSVAGLSSPPSPTGAAQRTASGTQLQEEFATSVEDVEALQSERDAAVAEVADLRARLAEMQQTASVAPAAGVDQPAASETSPEDAAMQTQLLQLELDDLRQERGDLELRTQQAAARMEREHREEVERLEREAAAARAAAAEAEKDAAAFAQDLAKHMQADGASADALREQLDQAAAERAAALKDVQYLSAQLQTLLDQQDGRADQDGNSPAALPSANGHPASSNGDGGNWLSDGRWKALRRLGSTSGWLIDPTEVSLGKVIGEGSFGTTYQGTWKGGDCAVKCVRIANPDEAQSFLREVETLALIRHPNIMPFYGAVLQPPQHCWLVCEFLPGGTLSQWLYGTRGDPRAQGSSWGRPRLSLESRCVMGLEVARGMQALEESVPPVLHRDLKPTNIFVDAGGHARVADMGLSRRLEPGAAANLTGETGTYFYMAPEVFRHEVYDTRADVYSWGVLLAELVAQKPPYDGMYLTPTQVAMAVADDSLRPVLPDMLHPGLMDLLQACFSSEPEQRPSFAMVVDHLSRLVPEVAQAEAAASVTGGNRVFGRLFSKASAAVGAPAQAPAPVRGSLSPARKAPSPARSGALPAR